MNAPGSVPLATAVANAHAAVEAAMESEWFCGCCGDETVEPFTWCVRCESHVAPADGRPAWDRTHFATTGRDCPYQVGK